MKINVLTKNLKLTPAIKDLIEERIGSLEKFINILYNEKPVALKKLRAKVEAWVEVGKETLHHKKGPFFRAECQMKLLGRDLRAESLSPKLEIAINEMRDILKRKLKEERKKMMAKAKRRSRKIKRKIKFSSGAEIQEKLRTLQEDN